MSRVLVLQTLSQDERKRLSKELTVEQPPSRYAPNIPPKKIPTFDVQEGLVYVPFAYNSTLQRKERTDLPNRNMSFTTSLRPEQKQLVSEAFKQMNKTGSVVLSCYTGFGKTCTGIYMACQIRLPTLIICHRVILINQWVESIQKFCNKQVSIQVVKGGDDNLSSNADFYIINAINVPKLGRKAFEHIGLLVVDECHLIMADKLSQSMKYVCPRYVIGLSATPYRTDGLNRLLDLYFGEYKIIRTMSRPFTVYKVSTNVEIEAKLNVQGKVDWNSVIESQSESQSRNELIISLLKAHSTRIFLVLCKRVKQARILYDRLKEEKENVDILVQSDQTFDKNCRILIATSSKAGVGFDFQELNTLLLASDVKDYFVQYLGRIFRKQQSQETVQPMVFDLVDDFPLLEKHFKSRLKVYKEMGGTVKPYQTL
jgi:superfamily II DNA or RNA helicase